MSILTSRRTLVGLVAAPLLLAAACGGTAPAAKATGTPASASPTATAAAATATASPAASTAGAVKVANVGAFGPTLVDSAGKTLYISTTDGVGTGKSVCNAACAAT